MDGPVVSMQRVTIYEGKSFTITNETLKFPNGATVVKDFVRHPGAVVLLPQLSNNSLVLIKQYRHAIARELLEFPAGTLEPGEHPAHCAQRELSEETGYAAREWIPFGQAYPAPGFCDEIHHYFLARGLSPFSSDKDEDEIISVCEMTVPQVEQAIADEILIDTKSIAAFTKARLKSFL